MIQVICNKCPENDPGRDLIAMPHTHCENCYAAVFPFRLSCTWCEADQTQAGSYPLHPIHAMSLIADETPNPCEGSRGHLRQDFAWDVEQAWQRATAAETIAEYEEGYTPRLIRESCTRDGISACGRWTKEDRDDEARLRAGMNTRMWG